MKYSHSKPKNVKDVRTTELIATLHNIPTLSIKWLELQKDGWQIFVVDQKRGRCYPHKKWITIPLWSIEKRGKGYWIYYVAHEFAHTYPNCNNHGAEFMRWCKFLCPQEYWHYELEYKNQSARAAGITKEHAHKAVDVKLIDLFDLL